MLKGEAAHGKREVRGERRAQATTFDSCRIATMKLPPVIALLTSVLTCYSHT